MRPWLSRFPRLLLVVGGLALGALGPACSGGAQLSECLDGRDNDGDGRIDDADPACAVGDRENDDPPVACNDTVDNDDDGRIDFPDDPGCDSALDADEFNSRVPACDPSCTAASGDSEFAACVSADPVVRFTSNLTGATTAGHADDVSLTCGFGDGADDIYRVFVTQPLVSLTVDTDGSAMSTTVAWRSVDCASGVDLACGSFNSGPSGDDARATLTTVAVGEYFAIVDDLGASTPATYNLHVTGILAPGSTCTPTSTSFVCVAGYACAGATPTCVVAACNDAVDADGDGRPGFPSDPGCTSLSDNDESDACPSGPGCPACSNGLDDDADTRVDYPLDLGCGAASGTSELECQLETDPIVTVSTSLFVGTTAGAHDNFVASCGAVGATAPDRVHFISLRVPVATLVVDTENSSFDTTLSFTDSTCAPTIACDDDGASGTQSLLTQTNVAPGTYALIVDGFSAGEGAYNLNVRGTIAAGSSCNDPLVAAGVLTCAPGTSCVATICAP